MSDPGPAAALYPDLARDTTATPAPHAAPTSDAARSLYGDGKTVAKPIDGVSALGGQARETEPEPAAQRQQQQPARSEPFNPTKINVEGLQADPALMGEFSKTARELGLDHAGAERLVQLHAKAQRAADAAMDRQSETWLAETLKMPKHELEAAKSLVQDASLTDPELRQWLETSPAGNWAPLVRTLANWARAIRGY